MPIVGLHISPEVVKGCIDAIDRERAARKVRLEGHQAFRFAWGKLSMVAEPVPTTDAELYKTHRLEWRCEAIGLRLAENEYGHWDAGVRVGGWLPYFKVESRSHDKGGMQWVVDRSHDRVERVRDWASNVLDGREMDTFTGEAVEP